MPAKPLSSEQVSDVLVTEMIVRVAFQDRNAPYVIPFGYAYHDGRLYGVTAPGRKTVIAEQNPRVGFQVDSSARTGPWEWRSVTGDGDFELVDDERERAAALAALEPLNARAPEWWQDEIRPLMASGNARVWRLTPDRISGVEYARPG